jgi:hypothetical protein
MIANWNNLTEALILRSNACVASRRQSSVLKNWAMRRSQQLEHCGMTPSPFETRLAGAPQDEGF